MVTASDTTIRLPQPRPRGEMSVESTPGAGAKFTVSLPAPAQEAGVKLCEP